MLDFRKGGFPLDDRPRIRNQSDNLFHAGILVRRLDEHIPPEFIRGHDSLYVKLGVVLQEFDDVVNYLSLLVRRRLQREYFISVFTHRNHRARAMIS